MSSPRSFGAGASASSHLKRWRTATVALLVLALIGSLMALTVPPPSVAGAQDPPPGVTTSTSWPTDCIGSAAGVEQPEKNNMNFQVTAPAQVAPDEVFTIRIAPQNSAFPDKNPSPLGEVTVNRLLNINFMYNLPTNSTVQSVEIVPGTGFGTAGTPTVAIDSVNYSPARIVLKVPEVPKNNVPPTNETFFQLPAIDVTVQATGALGSNVSTRFSGFNQPSSGYVFQADSLLLASVRCWPEGEVPAPLMSQTAISSGGGVTTPTTTGLAVDPTTLPAGYDATMTATVTAPSGVVRFNDGTTVLGYSELNEEGIANLTASLNVVGSRSITASYLGSPGFDASISAPVAVTVTNPANRTPVQVGVTVVPARLVIPATFLSPPTIATTVVVTPTGGVIGTPSGSVRLYDNDVLVATQTLVGGSATFTSSPSAAGHRLRAEYSGDTEFFAAAGTAPLPATNQAGAAGANVPALDQQITASTTHLNAATGGAPVGSVLNSSFRTNSAGVQTLDGVLVFPAGTLTVPGGTVTGQLAQAGTGTGQIAAGSGGAASYSTQLFYQVASADLGSGVETFASGCAIGPFSVNLTGNRTGTNGPVTVAQSGFSVPFAASGTCVNANGVSRSGQIGAIFAGGITDLSLTFTPPAAAVATSVSPVTVTPNAGASFGEPVTLEATVTPSSGTFGSGAGAIEFFVNGNMITSVLTPSGNAPTKTASVTLPREGNPITPPLDPLPQGTSSIQARYVPSNAQKLNFATSALSSSVNYTVLPAVSKQTPIITLEVVETAPAGEPVTLNIHMTPAPNIATGPAPLAGTLIVIDEAVEDAQRQSVAVNPYNDVSGLGVQGGLQVTPSSDGFFTTQTALAPGVHELRAIFTPAVTSAWAWEPAMSEVEPHVVIGEQIPTSLSVTSETSYGTGQVPVGQNLYVEVQLDPKVVAAIGPLRLSLLSGENVPVIFDVNGRATFTILASNHPTPGVYERVFVFDPAFRTPVSPGSVANIGNQGFAPSELIFTYEAVNPGSPGPMTTATEIRSVNPSPVEAGTVWSQVNGYTTFNAAGSVSYVARNMQTTEVTALGTVSVSNTTNATTGRGLARLNNPAVTSSLPAGTYEVVGSFTPTNPANFAPSTSAPFLVHVVDSDEPIVSETTLSVTPAGTSEPGDPVLLEASVTPGTAAGTVEFLDGETSLGTAPVVNGSASTITWALEPGEHQLSAVFTPTSPLVEGSSSVLIPHLVADPAIETETVLTVSPEGTSLQGEDVTLTATVTPEGAVGTVVFEDEHGELGEAELVDGEAVLVIGDLEPGTHELVAVFEPDPESDFATSVSEEVTHEVTAQAFPAPPLDVTALGGGLMATVAWDAPEDDGGEPITGYTVYISDGEEPEEWDFPVADVAAGVTTVDVIGLEADTDYTFKVTAWNSIGESELSEASNTVTVGPATYEFSDMNPGDDFFAEITWMAETGLSTGFEPGPQYRPGATLTRQAMSAFIYRINGSPEGDNPTCDEAPFPDVTLDNDFCGEIAWMKAEGITTGNSDGTFNPAGGLSRQAMSAFLYRSANPGVTPEPCTVAPFPDVPTTNQFCPEITWMADTGISEGFEDGDYKPFQDLTRRAMSAFLYRYTLVVPTSVV